MTQAPEFQSPPTQKAAPTSDVASPEQTPSTPSTKDAPAMETPARSSRIPGFYRLDVDDRHRELEERFGLAADELAILKDGSRLDVGRADKMVENCVGVFGLPIGLGLNFQVNGRDYAVPMVVEEPSVVAAVSNMARTVRKAGGFTAEADDSLMIGQVQILGAPDPVAAVETLRASEQRILEQADAVHPNMKRRVQQPTEVVSLTGCEDLRGIAGDARSGVSIGAMTTLTEIERDPYLQEHYPSLTHAASVISTPLLRNMGTIGGNLLLDTRCNYYDQSYEWRESISFCMKCEGSTCWVAPSSPRCWAVQSSDTVPLLCAMGAEVTLLGPSGERRIRLTDLYQDDGIAYTTKQPGELLTRLHLPARASGEERQWRASYRKLRRRGSFDFPVLGVGVRLELEGDTVTDVDIRIGGAGSYAIPDTKTAEMLRGQRLVKGDANRSGVGQRGIGDVAGDVIGDVMASAPIKSNFG